MRLSLLDNRRNFLLYLDEDKVIQKYTVTWKNWDGSDLYVDTKAAKGGIPGYAGPTPTKPATQTVSYEFAGWTPSVVAVTGNTTYTATFTEIPIMVQVQWLNYDSSVIKIEEVQAGTKPIYSGTNPTKPSTTQYRYNFTGWSPNPVVIYEDTVYTAQFQEVPNTVTATFIKDSSDGGGTIKTVTVNYGETPVFGSSDPTSTKGIPPEITFEGWEPALGPITQNTTYTAVFKDNRPYTVQFLARTISEYTDVHEALTEANVTWLNWDGSLLELDRDVPIGTIPSYDGATPTRPAVPGYTYTFAGWDKQIVPLTGYTTYTATYTEVVETHKAIFIKASADGGGTLQTINAVPYNTTPNYTAATPTTSKGTAEVFPFVGWDPPLGPMTADTTYTAVFDDLRPYTVRFLDRSITEYEG